MRLSRYFLPILKETPKEAEIVSHRLMLRAGMIRQEAAGIYAWLPLGLRVLKKIEAIVREEQNRAGAIELLMPTLQLADLWRESGRYDAYGPEMLRIVDRHKRELLYGPTNEEMITEIFRGYVKSYKSLPLNLYHIQWKFRDEQRPRFGVMREAFLQSDVRRLSAHLRAHGPQSDPDACRNRTDRRRSLPRIHRARRDRRVRRVLRQERARSADPAGRCRL
jgi:prolyl-tRNA synthetase